MKILALILISCLLWSCASIPQTPSPQTPRQPEVWIDRSQPTLASMYYFLSGSYLNASGERAVATQVFAMAMDNDRLSPQIRKAHFMNSAQFYRSMDAEEARILMTDLLRQARKDYQFDEEMLFEAFASYVWLDDIQGMKWASDELVHRFPGARAYYYQFIYEQESSGKSLTRLLEKAQKLNDGDEEISQLIAISWIDIDNEKAISILKSLKPTMLNESLLQSLLSQQKDQAHAANRFRSLRYPEDLNAMAGYLYFYYEKHNYPRILEQAERILETKDPGLNFILASAAYRQQDDDVFLRIIYQLSQNPVDIESDSRLAALVLMQAISKNDQMAIQTLSPLIYDSADLNLALFSVVVDVKMSDDEVAEKKSLLAEDIRQNMPSGALKDYLLFITAGNAADTTDPAFLAYAGYLWNQDRGGITDFNVLISHYASLDDEESQIRYMRKAVQRWPLEAMWMNNLGYILLSYPEHWDEAERLIRTALRREPESIHYQDSMAWLHYLRGDYAHAAKYLPNLEASSDDSAELFYHIGMIYLAINDAHTGQKFLERAVNTGYPEHFVRKAKAQLELLK